MNKAAITISFLLCVFVCFAQKVEITDRSPFKHSYLVKDFVYVENLTDTNQLKYMARLKIHEENYPHILSSFYSFFKKEALSIGANAYYVDSFTEKDSSVTVTIRLYFASEKFIETNSKNFDKDKMYFFSSARRQNRDQTFYINGIMVLFPSDRMFTYAPEKDSSVEISTYRGERPSVAKGKQTKRKSESEFYAIGYYLPKPDGVIDMDHIDKFNVAGNDIRGYASIFAPAAADKKKKMGYRQIKYEPGRMLLGIYSLQH